jgi:hypothetical protein
MHFSYFVYLVSKIYVHIYHLTYGSSTATMAPPMIQANVTMPHFNTYMTSSDMGALYIQGGYTSLLLGVDQDATLAIRQLRFDGVSNNENI